VWVDRQGTVREAIDETRAWAIQPSLSPDGSQIALTSTEADRLSILVLEPARGTRRWLARTSAQSSYSPAWSADGKRLFSVGPGPTGSDTEDQVISVRGLTESSSETLVRGYAPKESPDGKYLVYSVGDFLERDIHYVDRLESSAEPLVFLEEPGFQGVHEFSPDGRFIAFLHSNTGMTGLEVYLSPFPGGGNRVQVSSGGVTYQTQIRWRSDGKRLYYLRAADGMLMEVEVNLRAELELSPPVELFSDTSVGLDLGGGFDVSPDGERFLVTRATVPSGGDRGGIVLIQNWLALLPSSGKMTGRGQVSK
jgi:Tol biopolymer transport system component